MRQLGEMQPLWEHRSFVLLSQLGCSSLHFHLWCLFLWESALGAFSAKGPWHWEFLLLVDQSWTSLTPPQEMEADTSVQSGLLPIEDLFWGEWRRGTFMSGGDLLLADRVWRVSRVGTTWAPWLNVWLFCEAEFSLCMWVPRFLWRVSDESMSFIDKLNNFREVKHNIVHRKLLEAKVCWFHEDQLQSNNEGSVS